MVITDTKKKKERKTARSQNHQAVQRLASKCLQNQLEKKKGGLKKSPVK
jgi:hypothetical protein